MLESFYEVERSRIALLIRSALALPSIEAIDTARLLRALEVYETNRVDLAEAYLVAQAEASGVGEIVPFDQSIHGVASVKRREP